MVRLRQSKKESQSDDSSRWRVVEECKNLRKHHQQSERMVLGSALAGLYGLVTSILGIMIPLSFFLTLWERSSVEYYVIFYNYMFVTGSIFLIWIMVKIRKVKKQMASAASADVKLEEDIKAAGAKNHQNDAMPLLANAPEGLNFYMQMGFMGFGLASISLDILMLISYAEDEKTWDCYGVGFVIVFVFRLVFVIIEMVFCFSHFRTIINFNRPLVKFGLAHVMATNMAIWGNNVLVEAIEAYVHEFANHHEESHHNSSHSNSYQDTNISTSHYVTPYAQGDSIATTAAETGNLNPLIEGGCLEIESTVSAAAAYLFPFYVEFAIIAISILYKIYSNVYSNPEPKSVKIIDPNNLHLMGTTTKCGRPTGFNPGLFLGYLVMTGYIAITAVYIQLESGRIHTDDEFLSVHLYFGTNISVTVVALVALVFTIPFVRKFHYVEKTETYFDEVLLLVALAGHYFLLGFIIVAATDQMNVEGYTRFCTFYVVFVLISYIQATLQVTTIRDGLHRRIVYRKHLVKRPGNNIVAFMITINLSMWVINTFMLKQISQSVIMKSYYGPLTWIIITSIFNPVNIFFRFHSGACFSDIFECAYYEGCYMCGKSVVVNMWEVKKRNSNISE